MEYCCHIWGGSSNDALSLLDKVQKRIVNIVGPALVANLQPFSNYRNVASLFLFYKYVNEYCSKELASLVPTTKIYSRITRHSIKSHPFSVAVPKCSKNSYSEETNENNSYSSFFCRTSCFPRFFPSSCFPNSYNWQSFRQVVC
ncbi:uncharacterized protein LOC136074603 [Hydra vulgaris]|uniref:Uncharacterized protein LOC136074603 n=1 Tax=Hydra vulgaris TaxID=6087 RepID=A0ABM4B2I9_HYDVU